MTEPSDPLERLRRLTPARVGLGRCGDALPTRALLEFELAHARARDAVRAELDVEGLRAELAQRVPGETVVAVRTRAGDRDTYLQRPDLGASLHPEDHAKLTAGGYDAVFVIADGLSAPAVHAHAAETLAEIRRNAPAWAVAPLVIARQARVALGDPIGAALAARLSIVLIGERPGLSSPDSLGAYLTFAPRPGRSNADRNCVSNIRPNGLTPRIAGARIAALATQALRQRLSGIELKDRSTTALSTSGGRALPRRAREFRA